MLGEGLRVRHRQIGWRCREQLRNLMSSPQPPISRRHFESKVKPGWSSGTPQIVASALEAGAAQVLSDDLRAGLTITGIGIVNPFASAS